MIDIMPTHELPHSLNCLVCGRENSLGMKLSLHIDDGDGKVRCTFEPTAHHVGFDNIVHGGAIATVVDEAMVWAATWRGRRFCLCGELVVRFREPVHVGEPVLFVAEVERTRPRLIETVARITNVSGSILYGTANGKYVPVAPDQHRAVLKTMVKEPQTHDALEYLSFGM